MENRQTNYIINIDHGKKIAFQKSIIEAGIYIDKDNLRRAAILSNEYRDDSIKKVKYNATQMFKKGSLGIIERSGQQNNKELLIKSLYGFKNGMFLIDKGIVTDEIADVLLKVSEKKEIDFVVHRKSIELLNTELQFVQLEIDRANTMQKNGAIYKPKRNIYLCLHDDERFPFSPDKLKSLIETFGTSHGFNIFLAQYIAVRKTLGFTEIIENTCKRYNEKFEDFVDPVEFEKMANNFVYYNFLTSEITGVEPEFKGVAHKEIIKAFKLQ